MKLLTQSRRVIHRRPRLTFAAAMLILLGGVYLIWSQVSATAPDPAKGDLAAATGFLRGDGFMSMTSAQREAYLAALGARYLQEPPANRATIEAALKANGVERRSQRSMALGMLRSLLHEYRGLSPEEKQKRIVMLRAFCNAMGFAGPSVAGLNPKANPVADATGSQDGFQKGMAAFNRDFLHELNAEERSTLAMLAEDIHKK